MKQDTTPQKRVVGLDCHPDSFTAAIVEGTTPANAIEKRVFHKLPLGKLIGWAKKHTTVADELLLEASGNSFHIARLLLQIGRQVHVLESAHIGKLKNAHADNDKTSAVRIAKAYLAGTAKIVWLPDGKTQERRDCFLAHQKAVKRDTQLRNRILSYLSDHGVRPSKDKKKEKFDQKKILAAAPWTPRQQQVIQIMLMELTHAQQQRKHWTSLMAQEVLQDPKLLQLTRICGIRDQIAFALGAVIGDITRFENPKSLCRYFGLDPAFQESGESKWEGGIAGHGRKDIRSLLIEAAQSILRTHHPLAQWGRKLLARKSKHNLVVAAMARKVAVSVWYLMNGHWTELEEIDSRLRSKIGKIVRQLSDEDLKRLGKKRTDYRQETLQILQESSKAQTKKTTLPGSSTQTTPSQEQEPKPQIATRKPKIYVLDPRKVAIRKNFDATRTASTAGALLPERQSLRAGLRSVSTELRRATRNKPQKNTVTC